MLPLQSGETRKGRPPRPGGPEGSKKGRTLLPDYSITAAEGEDEWLLTFQSRFGRAEWLQPYTDVTLAQLARDGVRAVDVLCPGFAVDCLETLEEIAVENAQRFRAAGGEQLRYIPALNATPGHVAALVALARRHAQGWPH